MCATISMTYDVTNRNATDMLQLLLASGFFTVNETVEDWTCQEEKEAFLATSKHNFARILAKEL